MVGLCGCVISLGLRSVLRDSGWSQSGGNGIFSGLSRIRWMWVLFCSLGVDDSKL